MGRKCGTCKSEGHDKRSCPKEKEKKKQQLITIPNDERLSFVVFDLETTGKSTKQDRIVQICYKLVEQKQAVPNTLNQALINADVSISAGAQQVHGISNKTMRAKGKNLQEELRKIVD